MSVLKPWTAVKTNKTAGGYEVSVLGRKCTLHFTGFETKLLLIEH